MSEYVVPEGAVTYTVRIVDGVVVVRFYDFAGTVIGGYSVPEPVEAEGVAW